MWKTMKAIMTVSTKVMKHLRAHESAPAPVHLDGPIKPDVDNLSRVPTA